MSRGTGWKQRDPLTEVTRVRNNPQVQAQCGIPRLGTESRRLASATAARTSGYTRGDGRSPSARSGSGGEP